MDLEAVFSDSQALLETIKEADKLTREVHGPEVYLERAIILSWWCDKGSCSFCYMSTQKERIEDKDRARRRRSSILAEAELLKRIGWKIAFISGGYGAYSIDELKSITQRIRDISGEPTWLNVGALAKDDLLLFEDDIEGVVGSVEAVGTDLREVVCPGKPLGQIIQMFRDAKDIGLKRGMTLILGLGESIDDLPKLIEFIREHEIDKITVYSLNPHSKTPFSGSPPPASLYQAGVIASLRLEFPSLTIVAGTWIDQLPNIGIVLLAGANGITKYPLFRMFGNRFGRKVEEEIAYSGRKMIGTFTDVSRLKQMSDGILSENEDVEAAINRYVNKIEAGLLR
jgi:biotin synthase-like enzyme